MKKQFLLFSNFIFLVFLNGFVWSEEIIGQEKRSSFRIDGGSFLLVVSLSIAVCLLVVSGVYLKRSERTKDELREKEKEQSLQKERHQITVVKELNDQLNRIKDDNERIRLEFFEGVSKVEKKKEEIIKSYEGELENLQNTIDYKDRWIHSLEDEISKLEEASAASVLTKQLEQLKVHVTMYRRLWEKEKTMRNRREELESGPQLSYAFLLQKKMEKGEITINLLRDNKRMMREIQSLKQSLSHFEQDQKDLSNEKNAKLFHLNRQKDKLKNELILSEHVHLDHEQSLQERVEMLKEELKKALQKYKSEKEKVDEYEGVFRSFKNDKQRLLTVLEEKNHQLKEQKSNYVHQIEKLKYLLKYSNTKRQEKEDESREKGYQIGQYQEKIEKQKLIFEGKLKERNVPLRQLTEENERLREEIKTLEERLEDSKNEQSHQRIELEELRVKFFKCQDKLKISEKRNKEDEKNYEQLLNQKRKEENDRKDLMQDYLELQRELKKIGILKGQKDLKTKELKKEKEQLKEMKKEKDHWMEVSEDLEHQLSIIQEEHKTEVQDLKIKYEHGEGMKVQQLRDDKRRLKIELQEMNQRIDGLEKEKSEIEEQLKGLKEKVMTVNMNEKGAYRSRRRSSVYKNPLKSPNLSTSKTRKRRAMSAIKERPKSLILLDRNIEYLKEEEGGGTTTRKLRFSPEKRGRSGSGSRKASKSPRTVRNRPKRSSSMTVRGVIGRKGAIKRTEINEIKRDVMELKLREEQLEE